MHIMQLPRPQPPAAHLERGVDDDAARAGDLQPRCSRWREPRLHVTTSAVNEHVAKVLMQVHLRTQMPARQAESSGRTLM